MRPAAATLLVLLVACGVAVRASRWPEIFLGDAIVFPVGDAYYHLRRAEYTLANPGRLLLFDPLVNQPDGAWIPWPPLHTLLLAGAAQLAGGTREALERVAAWYPPLVGAATALPVYGAARCVGGPGLALLAAAIAALLPASVTYSDLGNADHHVTVSFFGALWLWGALAAMRAERGRGLAAAQALAAAGRLGVLFTWAGSLLYVVVADGACVAIALLCGRVRLLVASALALAACAALAWLAVPLLGPPVGGPYSTLALSYLHPAAMGALAFQALACAWLEARRPARSVALRAARAAGVAAVGAAALLALPGLLASLREAAGFVGKQDPWAALNAEQRPLVRARLGTLLQPLWYYGGFGYLIPLVPIAAALRARDPRWREPSLVLALWTAAFGALAVTQLRYGADYAPAAAVGFAVTADEIGRRFGAGTTRARIATALTAAFGLAPIAAQHALQARASLAAARQPVSGDPLLQTATGTLYRFAEEIRRVTPETAGYRDATAWPEYAILCPANIGHLLHYVAERATPSDNFGPYSGSRHFGTAQRFFNLKSEARATAVADALRARYVVTVEYGPVHNQGLTQRLHREDGVELWEQPPWAQFRLVTEGPHGGRPLADLYRGAAMPGVEPYKLWERVPGALLAVRAPAGTTVQAGVAVRAPSGRTFRWVARATAGDDGVARLRVPYATDATTPVKTAGPWLVQAGLAQAQVAVPESAVLAGATVAVEPVEAR